MEDDIWQAMKKAVKIIATKIAAAIGAKILIFILLIVLFITMIASFFIGGAGSDEAEGVEDGSEMTSMEGSSEEGFNQLLRWLAMMEHGIDLNTYDKDYYEFLSDGYGGVAILGLDTRYYGNYFSGLGYNTSPGSQVPRDIVEQKYRDVVQEMYDEVKNTFTSSGCNLTEYQLYAMTARRYNWGHIADEDVSSYKAYWNQSTDDMFGQKKKEGDYTHQYFTKCLCEPSNDGVLTGRRKSEWTLFQCGYFDAIDEWYIEPTYASGDAAGLLECAERIHKYMEDNKYTYDGNYADTFEGSKQYKACVCASFVSWVLQECGYTRECHHECGGLDEMLAKNSNFQRINDVKKASQLMPGDIMIYEGYWEGGYGRIHTEIYAGNNTIYNAGSTTALQRENPYYKDMQYAIDNTYSVTRVYRLKSSSSSSDFTQLLKKGGITESTLTQNGATQLVVVNSSGSSATVTFYEKSNNTWKENTSLKCQGIVGANGVGQASEGSSTTPKGLHAIGEAFYRSNRPETSLSLFNTKDQYWVDEPSSKYYNQKLNKQGWTNAGSPHAEDMYSITPQYNYGFVIKYNMPPTGNARGSAFFFHVRKSGASSTAGCVAVDEKYVLEYLKKLSGAKKPYILII